MRAFAKIALAGLLTAALAALLVLTTCNEVVRENYRSYAEAEAAGAVRRGWIPSFVPPSATDIETVHDLDSNSNRLSFTVAPQSIDKMLASMAPTTRLRGEAAYRALSEAGLDTGKAATSETYRVRCTVNFSVVVVERKAGLVVYRSPSECPDPL